MFTVIGMLTMRPDRPPTGPRPAPTGLQALRELTVARGSDPSPIDWGPMGEECG